MGLELSRREMVGGAMVFGLLGIPLLRKIYDLMEANKRDREQYWADLRLKNNEQLASLIEEIEEAQSKYVKGFNDKMEEILSDPNRSHAIADREKFLEDECGQALSRMAKIIIDVRKIIKERAANK